MRLIPPPMLKSKNIFNRHLEKKRNKTKETEKN